MYETQFEIDGKWTTVANGNTLLQQLSKDTNSTIIKVGESELGEDIIGLKIGDGINKTLVTSGVHGVEPASREAVLIKLRDICLNKNGLYSNFLNNHTILIIPTINPDQMFKTYRNSKNIDINRVSFHLDSTEGLSFLRVIRDFKPDAFFDFHEHSGKGDIDVRFVYPMMLDPNTDKVLQETQENAINYSRDYFKTIGVSSDYYYTGNTGFGSLTCAASLLGIPCYTSETYVLNPKNDRVDIQKISVDKALEWHSLNAENIKKMKIEFNNNMLDSNDAFTLLNGMNPGAEMYTQAQKVPIKLPLRYKVENIDDFKDFIDIYNIDVVNNNEIPIKQNAGRLLPYMLDPKSDLRKIEASRIEVPNFSYDKFRTTKVLQDEWGDIEIGFYLK